MQVNGEQVTLETPVSVADYLEAHGLGENPVHRKTKVSRGRLVRPGLVGT